MDALRVLADDLTGACDVGAELLPGPAGVIVQPTGDGGRMDAAGAISVRNTQSRTLSAADAAQRVRNALVGVAPGWAGLLLKKIDTGLRGPLGAELDAAMEALGAEEAFVLPAIPEIGRTTQQGRQMIGGIPVHETPFARDPHHPIRDASVIGALAATGRRPAALLDLGAVRGDLPGAIAAARARGAEVLVCDAETDADLERAVRVMLLRRRPLLLVGSTGLARALRRVLGTEIPPRRPRAVGPAPLGGDGILVVAGSAHPATRAQVDRARERGLVTTVVVQDPAQAEDAGVEASRHLRAGAAAVLVPPLERADSAALLAALRRAALTAFARARPDGLVLIGGETGYHVLEGLGLPDLWLETRLCPLVVRGRLMSGPYAGLAVVTKGGSAGAPDLVGAIVRQLARGAV
jgi:uncharacterized protein YgbK (DUF1537 family)